MYKNWYRRNSNTVSLAAANKTCINSKVWCLLLQRDNLHVHCKQAHGLGTTHEHQPNSVWTCGISHCFRVNAFYYRVRIGVTCCCYDSPGASVLLNRKRCSSTHRLGPFNLSFNPWNKRSLHPHPCPTPRLSTSDGIINDVASWALHSSSPTLVFLHPPLALLSQCKQNNENHF